MNKYMGRKMSANQGFREVMHREMLITESIFKDINIILKRFANRN
jgi:hypothetical protein